MTVGLSPERGDSIAVHAIERAPGGLAVEPLAAAPAPAPAPAVEAPALGAARLPRPAVSWSDPFADGRWTPATLASLAVLAALAAAASWLRTGGGLSLAQRKSLLVELRSWLAQHAPRVDPRRKP